MRNWIPSSSVLSADRVASARQTRGHGPVVEVSALTGGLGLLLSGLLLLLAILLLGNLLAPALISASEGAEQRAGGGPDRRPLAGISGNRAADRAQRRTPSATT